MSRDKTIAVHCSSSLKRDIEEISGEQSTSEYVRDLLNQHVVEKNADDYNRKADAEERIEKVARRATDEIQAEAEKLNKTAQHLQNLAGKTGTYTIANFELLNYHHDIPKGMQDDAIKTGSRRLREDLLDGVELDPDDLGLAGEQPDDETEEDADNGSMPWQQGDDE